MQTVKRPTVPFHSKPKKLPHRGALVLVLGILSLFIPILAPITWSVGGYDLDRMAMGRMHNRDAGMTKAGVVLAQMVMGIWVFGILAGIIYLAIVSP